MSYRSRSSRPSFSAIEPLDARVLLAGDLPVRQDLSDMTPSYVMNGFGPIGINLSNGEEAEADGKRMRINGKRYDNGIGVHSYSEVRYALDGQFRSFVSDVGLDDEVGTDGSVVFQVYADGTKLFDSGVMTGRSAFKRVNVDVAGREELRLIVRDGGDGTDSDHADWGDAHLRRNVGPAPEVKLASRVTLDEPNSTLKINGSFADESSDGPWTVTVDWGDSSGIKRLVSSGDNQDDFALRHKFDAAKPGTYNVAVHVSNGRATGVATCQVTVNNVAPSNVGLMNADEQGRVFTKTGLEFVGYGVFEDPGKLAEEAYTYRVNYGDGSEIETGDVPARLFFFHHTYQQAGTYTVSMNVIDEAGNIGSGVNTVVVTDPQYTYLSDVDPAQAADGSGNGFSRDANSKNGGALKINGKRFDKGLGVTAVSDLTYDLARNYRVLRGEIGMDDYGNGESSVIFRVFTDGNEIFNSGAMDNASPNQTINLDVTGADSLRLVVTRADDGSAIANADWAGIRIA